MSAESERDRAVERDRAAERESTLQFVGEKLVAIASWYLEFSAGVIDVGKKLVIWGAFFALLWFLRDFFGLLFLTFILGFIANNLVERIAIHYPGKRPFVVVDVFIFILVVLVGLGWYTLPRIYREGEDFVRSLKGHKATATQKLRDLAEENPTLKQAWDDLKVEKKLGEAGEQALNQVTPVLQSALGTVLTSITYCLLSIIFSFLIVLDLPNLRREVAKLKETKLAPLYYETGESVLTFGKVLGRIFQAQAVIALLNTTFTLIGLFVLGIGSKGVLSIIVFFCSFIPVAGVFISSVPIVLLAVNTGGFTKGVWAVVLITVVHVIEAYILNPRIYASHMKMNPVLTLVILFLSHHVFGLWGVLLGVPVVYYIFKYAIALDGGVAARAEADHDGAGPPSGGAGGAAALPAGGGAAPVTAVSSPP